jgi:hypothetical protein
MGSQPTADVSVDAVVAPQISASPSVSVSISPPAPSIIVSGDPAPAVGGIEPAPDSPLEDPVDETLPEKLERLPAVSADGKRIGVLATNSAGARGGASLELLVIDTKTDAHLKQVEIDDPDKNLDPNLRDMRLKAASSALGTETWTPLVHLRITNDESVQPRGVAQIYPQVSTGAHTYVRYDEPQLIIRVDGQAALNSKMTAWSDKAKKACPQCQTCPPADAVLGSIYVDPTTRVGLFIVRYAGGNDTCWEPDETYHGLKF